MVTTFKIFKLVNIGAWPPSLSALVERGRIDLVVGKYCRPTLYLSIYLSRDGGPLASRVPETERRSSELGGGGFGSACACRSRAGGIRDSGAVGVGCGWGWEREAFGDG